MATVEQVVEVTHTGRTFSAFDLRGSITVGNSGATAIPVTVTTSIVGTTCHVTDGIDRSVPAASEATFSFVCDPGEGFTPGQDDRTTSTASWQQDGETHALTAAETISWDGAYLDNTVDVYDIDGDELSVLGSLMVDTDGTLRLLTPESGTVDGSVARFAYRAQLDGAPSSCKTYTSEAVVAGDDGEHVASDTASVAVCPRPTSPGLPHTGR